MNQDNNDNNQNSNGGRGFASMDREVQRNIASKGGRAAHRKGVAHEWDSEEASQAAQKRGSNANDSS